MQWEVGLSGWPQVCAMRTNTNTGAVGAQALGQALGQAPPVAANRSAPFRIGEQAPHMRYPDLRLAQTWPAPPNMPLQV